MRLPTSPPTKVCSPPPQTTHNVLVSSRRDSSRRARTARRAKLDVLQHPGHVPQAPGRWLHVRKYAGVLYRERHLGCRRPALAVLLRPDVQLLAVLLPVRRGGAGVSIPPREAVPEQLHTLCQVSGSIGCTLR